MRALRFLLSGALTAVIMIAISLAINDPAQAHSTRVVGVIVGVVIAAIPIYDIDSWSLLKRTIAHVIVMVVTVVPCLILSGWFDLSTTVGVLALLGTFVGAGVLGWGAGVVATVVLARQSADKSATQ